jgi:hypothetical protein
MKLGKEFVLDEISIIGEGPKKENAQKPIFAWAAFAALAFFFLRKRKA